MGKTGMNPDNWIEGGGLIDNVDTKWTEAVVQKGYKDGSYPDATILKVVFEADGEEHEEYYSAGSKCEPSEDGTGFAEGGALGSNTKMAKLLDSMIKAGFPKTKIQNDTSIFVGLECHMVRSKMPERKGLPRPARADGRIFEETALLVDTITKLPWEKKGKVATTKVTKTEEAKTSEDEAFPVEAKAQETILSILGTNPKGIDKKKLASLVFHELKDDPDRNVIAQLAYREEFLQSGPWTYEKGIVKA